MSRFAASAVVLLLVVTTAGCGGIIDGDTSSSTDVTERPVADSPTRPTETATGGIFDGPPNATSPGTDTPTRAPKPETATPDHPADSTPTDETAEQPTDRGDRTTRNANERLPVDVFETYDRTAAMMDTAVPIPTTAVDTFGDDDVPTFFDPFEERLNLTERADRVDDEAAGYATPNRITVVLPADPDADNVEQVLVHEYVHSIQYQSGMLPFEHTVDDDLQDTSEHETLRRALIEGAAVWATDEYIARHQAGTTRQSATAREYYLQGPPATRHQWAPYYLGSVYVDGRIDDPANMESVFEDPPRTTEQLLHGLEPGAEPPTDLAVSVEDEGRAWRAVDDDRRGELFVRVVLGTELTEPIAADAAAGWGNDVLHVFGDDRGREAFVWTLHWDDAAAADRFEAAFAAFLEQRTDEYADETRLVRVTDETVAVVIGPDGFHGAVSVDGVDTGTGTGTDVTITTGSGDPAANVASARTTAPWTAT